MQLFFHNLYLVRSYVAASAGASFRQGPEAEFPVTLAIVQAPFGGAVGDGGDSGGGGLPVHGHGK